MTKGGKNLKFRALVVLGNGQGKAGFGIGKAKEVPEAIRKGTEKARKGMFSFPLRETTIPHDVRAKSGASRVILKSAVKGHGMVVGKAMRAFLEVAGVRDVTGKCLGSTRPVNVVQATARALQQIKTKEQIHETASDQPA